MIKSIELQNFRSHKLTKISFHKGINAIIGSTGKGKTHILRALYWVKDNKPDGISYIAHFNRNEKGLPIEPTRVILELDEKIFIIRERSKEFNGYRIKKGKEIESFDAMNGKVPDQVSSLLNMDDVNVQKQLDAPFLLSNSAGEAARFLNNIIHLDSIDLVLSKADVKHRKLVVDKKSAETELEETVRNIKSFSFVEDAETLLEKIEAIQEEKDDAETKKIELLSIKNDLELSETVLIETKKIIKTESLVTDIEKIQIDIKSNKKERRSLADIKVSIEKCNDDINTKIDFDNAIETIDKIEDINALLKNNGQRKRNLQGLKKSIIEYKTFVITNNKYIDKLEKDLAKIMPDVCPLCGSDKKHFGVIHA